MTYKLAIPTRHSPVNSMKALGWKEGSIFHKQPEARTPTISPTQGYIYSIKKHTKRDNESMAFKNSQVRNTT